MYIGVDGCRGGWLVAIIDKNEVLHHRFIKSLNQLLPFTPMLALIDMPLNFADATYRYCEVAAQAMLGPKKRASVFYTPHREAVYAVSYEEANKLNKIYTGKGVSKQTWNICRKIKEAVAFAEAHPHFPLYEAHPELSFYWLNHQQPLLSKKVSLEGADDRLKIIAAHSENYPEAIENTMKSTKRKDVKKDDIIDATILAIRAQSGELQSVPTNGAFSSFDKILY